jgi:hypothetical protein
VAAALVAAPALLLREVSATLLAVLTPLTGRSLISALASSSPPPGVPLIVSPSPCLTTVSPSLCLTTVSPSLCLTTVPAWRPDVVLAVAAAGCFTAAASPLLPELACRPAAARYFKLHNSRYSFNWQGDFEMPSHAKQTP